MTGLLNALRTNRMVWLLDLRFWPGAVVMMLLATFTATLAANNGRSAWFVGVLVLMVYLIFAMTLYLLPPADTAAVAPSARIAP